MGYAFFLYGIYDEGQKCFPRFKNFITSSRPAYVKGNLYKLSCGLPLLAPGGEDVISGNLVELEIADSYWAIIDALNGFNALNPKKSLIVRQAVEVHLPESAPVQAQAYSINADKKVQGLELVPGGEWQTCMSSPQALIERLTDRQKTYIQKLSQAKGREIVPVDMALYRELMSLELIVDKGRRLALTHLGQEISLFL